MTEISSDRFRHVVLGAQAQKLQEQLGERDSLVYGIEFRGQNCFAMVSRSGSDINIRITPRGGAKGEELLNFTLYSRDGALRNISHRPGDPVPPEQLVMVCDRIQEQNLVKLQTNFLDLMAKIPDGTSRALYRDRLDNGRPFARITRTGDIFEIRATLDSDTPGAPKDRLYFRIDKNGSILDSAYLTPADARRNGLGSEPGNWKLIEIADEAFKVRI